MLHAITRQPDGYVSLVTDGGGACSLDAAFGLPTHGQMQCADGRTAATQTLRTSWHSNLGTILQAKVIPGIWSDLARPAALRALEGAECDTEAETFWSTAPELLRTRIERHVLEAEIARKESQAMIESDAFHEHCREACADPASEAILH